MPHLHGYLCSIVPFNINYTTVLDLLGTISFAVSGTSMAMQKRLDIFGILIIAFVASIGGGTLRDLIIGDTPVAWLQNAFTINCIISSCVLTVLFGTYIQRKMNITLFLFDALGLALCTFIGIAKGEVLGLSPGVCIALGMLSGCFGGVLRDVLLNEIPLVFRKEIYASTCILGGIVFYALLKGAHINKELAQWAGIVTIVLARIVVVKQKLQLPNMYQYISK